MLNYLFGILPWTEDDGNSIPTEFQGEPQEESQEESQEYAPNETLDGFIIIGGDKESVGSSTVATISVTPVTPSVTAVTLVTQVIQATPVTQITAATPVIPETQTTTITNKDTINIKSECQFKTPKSEICCTRLEIKILSSKKNLKKITEWEFEYENNGKITKIKTFSLDEYIKEKRVHFKSRYRFNTYVY